MCVYECIVCIYVFFQMVTWEINFLGPVFLNVLFMYLHNVFAAMSVGIL